jgi:hypothetical protein
MSVTPLTKIGRAAALSLVLAGSTLAAMPAQASHMSGHPGFSIEFDFGFGDRDHKRRFCDLMSLRQVRRDLRNRGYHDIDFVDRSGRIVSAEAERKNKDFLITYDRCFGQIIDRDRI